MKCLAYIIAISFIAIAVFGFVGFSSHHDSSFMICASNLTGQSCSNQDMAILHAKIYQGFSLGIVVAIVLGLLVQVYSNRFCSGNETACRFVYQTIESNDDSQIWKIDTWFELHQKRDPQV